MKKGDREAARVLGLGVKTIEGTFRVLSEDGQPVEPPPRRRPLSVRVVRYLASKPIFWVWVFMITFVGLTEGLW